MSAARAKATHLRLVPAIAEQAAPQVDDFDDFDALFERFAPYVATIGLRLLGRDDEVDDLVQEVFCVALRKLHQLRDGACVKSWLATVAVRMARRRLRNRRLRQFIGLDDWHDYAALADPGASPQDKLMISDLFEALDRVPSDARIAWSLHHLEGNDVRSIAALTDCSERTVKRRLRTARDILREAWDE